MSFGKEYGDIMWEQRKAQSEMRCINRADVISSFKENLRHYNLFYVVKNNGNQITVKTKSFLGNDILVYPSTYTFKLGAKGKKMGFNSYKDIVAFANIEKNTDRIKETLKKINKLTGRRFRKKIPLSWCIVIGMSDGDIVDECVNMNRMYLSNFNLNFLMADRDLI